MNQKKEIVGLQFLRGICAIGVVIDHAAGMASLDKYFGKAFFNGYLTFGAIGVDVFFVISGYIITISSLSPNKILPEISKQDFFKKRFLRIVPLMWISIITYAGLRFFGSDSQVEIQSYVNAIFLIPYGDVDPNQIWTLRHEALFYILFAVSFLGQRKMQFIVFSWFLSPFIYYGYNVFSHNIVVKQTVPAILFDPVNIEFAFGFFLGVWSLKNPDFAQMKIPIHPMTVLLILTVLVFAVGGLSAGNMDRLYAKMITGVIATGVVALAVCLQCPSGNWTLIGELLGSASYSIYLFHAHFESAMLSVLAKMAHWLPISIVIAGVSIGATMLSIGVYFFLEKPLISLMKTLFLPSRQTDNSP